MFGCCCRNNLMMNKYGRVGKGAQRRAHQRSFEPGGHVAALLCPPYDPTSHIVNPAKTVQ